MGEAVSGWKSIDTAPKDGTRVLLWCDNVKLEEIGRWKKEDPAETLLWDEATEETKKISYSKPGYWDCPNGFSARYWMQLPEHPNKEVERC
jgi:hypothetical protein